MVEKAIVLDNAMIKMGRLIRVYNKNKGKPTKNNYFYAVQVEDANGKNERCLLFEPADIEMAERRAAANKEDLTKKNFIVDMLD